MSASLLQLEGCRVLKLEVAARQDNVPDDPTAAVPGELSVNARMEQQPGHLRFRIGAEFRMSWAATAASHYDSIAVGLVGVFALPPDTPEDRVGTYVPDLCLANLYGTARGIVAQATALCPGGPFFLPILNLHAMLASAESQQQPDEKPVPPPAPPKPRRRRKPVAS